MKLPAWKSIGVAAALLWALPGAQAQTQAPAKSAAKPTAADALEAGFENPPMTARPQVWWHWMNGNITKQGIQLDLEWMHRVGISGFHNFDAALETPQVVDKRLAYMTPEWKDAFKYSIELAGRFGMVAGIAGSPGWSESGGPWVPPSDGMKKYVWSETPVEGGKPFHGKLVPPPSSTGAFQNAEIHDMVGVPSGKEPPQFYADAAVVAFQPASTDLALGELHPKITASGGHSDIALLSDGQFDHPFKLPLPTQENPSWILYSFPQPTTLRAISFSTVDLDQVVLHVIGLGAPEKFFEASDDGVHFREIIKLNGDGATQATVSFAPVTARYFRVLLKNTPPPPIPDWAANTDIDLNALGLQKPGSRPTDYEIRELVLHPGARIQAFEEKAAFVTGGDLYDQVTPAVTASDVIAKSSIIDLTGKMSHDGTLDWTPPAGKWIVMRLGYSLLGITNHPATAEATGLEVDKLDGVAVKAYFEKYLDSYKETVGPELMGKNGISFVINDSWEAGSQNWTSRMIEQFRRLRGYDPTPWLPVLTGRIVDSPAASDRFLWDLRKTIGDLIATEHYQTLEDVLHQRNMTHYGESHEAWRAFVGDGMEVKKMNEVPMSAMWTQRPGINNEQFSFNADDRESASVAHIYGQNIAAAESMTAGTAAWAWSPQTLKPTADQELLNGINRFVIHESAHQPLVGKAPGLTLGPYGQWFNRNETWAEQAKPWLDYLSRSSFLLQQGRFSADAVYFYGEDTNLTALYGDKRADVPDGYGYDFINADALIHELKVSGGELTTSAGMRYRVLYLDPNSQHMSLPVLKAIHALVAEGAIVAGPKPVGDPSLADDPAEFAKLTAELFGSGAGAHKVGKGTVYAGQSLTDVFHALEVKPDFDFAKPESDARIEFVHRKLADGDLYFIDNRRDRAEKIAATFRVAGKVAELWRPETGLVEPVSYKIADGFTTVPLRLEPWGTVFVVFRKPADKPFVTLPEPKISELASLDSGWKVDFQPGRGAPASIEMDKLASWSENGAAGVKYFSGIGVYSKTVDAPASWFQPGEKIFLDLGDVRNLAEVEVNGKNLGQVWHAPFAVNVTGALHQGQNTLVVKVTNAWVNRLIGDQQPGVKEKVTFATVKPYHADSPLLPSGLLGPVKLVAETAK
jgi:hypothetical protein